MKKSCSGYTRGLFLKKTALVLAITIFLSALPYAAKAGEKFSVLEFSPSGQVSEPTNIRIDFSTPVISSDDIGTSPEKESMPVVFTPLIQGQGMWISRSAFMYQLPNGYLPEATEFTATIPDKLKDFSGTAISGNKTFRFNTEPLKFLGIRQTDYRMDQEVVYEMTFNAPVKITQLSESLKITNNKGEQINCWVYDQGMSNTVTFRVTPDDGSPISIAVPAGLASAKGPLFMKNPVNIKVDRDLSLKITGASSSNYYSGSTISIRTTMEVDAAKASEFIEVTPEHNYNIGASNSEITITGDFPPRELITVKLKAGLPTVFYGGKLAEDWERAFIFPDYEPSLEFAATGRFISPANEELIVPFAAVNVNKLNVTVDRVYDNNVSFVTKDEWPYYIYNAAEKIYYREFDLSAKPNERTEFSIDLGKIINGRTGMFMIRAASGSYWPYTQRLVNVTDMAGSAKIGNRSALIWVNSISGGKPIKDVKADLYSNSNQIVASGTTDEHGVLSIKRESDWDENLRPSIVIMRKGDDVSVLRLEGNIWQTGNPEYLGAPYSREKYTGFVYMPRGIFRPGETVPVEMLLRNADLSPETPFPVQLKVYSALGREWNTSTVMMSEFGMASEEIQIGDAAPTGTWRADIVIPGENSAVASGYFLVEDFAPPKIEVSISSDMKELHRDDEPEFEISAQYLFGAAGAELGYEVETTLIPREYSHPDWPGYYFSDDRVQFTPNNDLRAEGTLSATGTASVTLPRLTHDARSILDAVFRAGVKEDGGRWVYKSLTLPYYPKDAMLGIKSPQGRFSTNTKIPFSFAAIKTDGNPINPEHTTLTVAREHRRNIMTTVDGQRRSELRTETIPLEGFDKKPVTFKNGVASDEVTFQNYGTYVVILEDTENNTASAMSFYVYDSRWGYNDEEEATLPEALSIKLDKDMYRAGEKARATVTGSFEGTILLSVETDNVLYYDTSVGGGKSAEFSFDVTKDMAPNAWITAHLVRAAKAEDAWSAHRAFGAAPLAVDCGDIKLGVEITAPEKIRPAETNTFSVKLTDSNGRGTPGEVSVMLADEGVLGLTNFKTPNFYEYYTGKRALTLYAYDVYTELMPLYLKTPAELTAGGGYDGSIESTLKASLSPVKAKRFKILTVVKNVATDENGNAEVSMDVSEFSGRARLMAVASSKTAFGSTDSLHTIARDVVADITLPRVLAPRDVFESQIQLFNRTNAPIEAKITLNIDGPVSITTMAGKQTENMTFGKKRLDGTVTIPAGEKAFSIPLLLKADDESGLVNISLNTEYGDSSQEQTIELAVRPPYPRITKTGALSVRPGETKVIELPTDWFPGTRRALVSISGLPSVALTDVAAFLLDYPYYCLEQTVSRGWALLAAPELASRIDPRLASREQSQNEMSRVIRRIQSMQLYSGAFSAWEMSTVSQWLSVYATHFLVACEKEGLDVPRETLRSALGYIRYLMSETPESSDKYTYGASLSTRAYIAYVLALKGEAPLAWMSYLHSNISSLPEYGRMYLAAAYALANDKKTAITLIGEEAPSIAIASGKERFNYDSPLRTEALRLMAWNEIEPSSPSAASAATKILAAFRSDGWYTTQEAGWGMIALSNFYSYNQSKGNAILSMSSEKIGLIATASGDNSVNRRIDDGISALQLTNSGSGTGYLTWVSDGVPTTPPSPEDKGMKVSVRYYDESGLEITDGSMIKNGAKVFGKIIIRPLGENLENIVVSLPLAGGLEIETSKYAAPQSESYEEEYDPYNNYQASRTEVRDDRLLLFVDYVGREFTWTFSMRAITPGTFTLPPIAAEGMYSPGIRSIGATSKITVK